MLLLKIPSPHLPKKSLLGRIENDVQRLIEAGVDSYRIKALFTRNAV